MRFLGWPSIEQFRNMVKYVKTHAEYIGRFADDNPLYDESLPKPKLRFHGTVKLHGTNAGVCYNPKDGIWVQSRENIITLTADNAGFARFVHANIDAFANLFSTLITKHNITFGDDTVLAIFGEWAGKGIQDNVAISQLPKAFYVFGAGFSENSEMEPLWLNPTELRDVNNLIYNVNDYPSWDIEIDFNSPEDVQEELARLALEVEASCPISKALGVDGLGEGIVWQSDWCGEQLYFKVKGEKHSVSSNKKTASATPDVVEGVNEFVKYACTKNRLEQALMSVFNSLSNTDSKRFGEVLAWMNKDILKEESDVLVENHLEWKQVAGAVAAATRKMFFNPVLEQKIYILHILNANHELTEEELHFCSNRCRIEHLKSHEENCHLEVLPISEVPQLPEFCAWCTTPMLPPKD